jgi:hypothetical protein
MDSQQDRHGIAIGISAAQDQVNLAVIAQPLLSEHLVAFNQWQTYVL